MGSAAENQNREAREPAASSPEPQSENPKRVADMQKQDEIYKRLLSILKPTQALVYAHLIMLSRKYGDKDGRFYRTYFCVRQATGKCERRLRDVYRELSAYGLSKRTGKNPDGRSRDVCFFTIDLDVLESRLNGLPAEVSTPKAMPISVSNEDLDKLWSKNDIPAISAGKKRRSREDLMSPFRHPDRLGYGADWMPAERLQMDYEEIRRTATEWNHKEPRREWMRSWFSRHWGQVYRQDLDVITEVIKPSDLEEFEEVLKALVDRRSHAVGHGLYPSMLRA